jgi:hypothetical protein
MFLKFWSYCGFDSEKLRRSLMKSGANSAVVDTILSQIEEKRGITTKKFIKAFHF